MNVPNLKKIESFSHFIQLMIDGLKKPWVEVDMGTYGEKRGKICYGCAATNALCELNQCGYNQYMSFNKLLAPEKKLEEAWDELRRGYDRVYKGLGRRGRGYIHNHGYCNNIKSCLKSLKSIEQYLGFTVPEYSQVTSKKVYKLLRLESRNYLQRLGAYQSYANELRSKGL